MVVMLVEMMVEMMVEMKVVYLVEMMEHNNQILTIFLLTKHLNQFLLYMLMFHR